MKSIRTYIRQAYKARYDIAATIRNDGVISIGQFGESLISDYRTIKNEAGNVLLYHRHILIFKFGN
jgi:hypothetical protein